MRRSVSVVVIDRANLGRLQPLLEELRKSDLFDLSVVCGGSTLASGVADSLESQGYKVHRVSHVVSGGTLHETSLGIGLGTLAYSQAFKSLASDFVILIGDRSEALAATTAAAHCGSQIVHLQGGEKSSTLDQKYRWAITALSDWHVPATGKAGQALLNAGVNGSRIIAVGCPSSDIARQMEGIRHSGEILVTYHPNTCHPETARAEADELFSALPAVRPILLLATNRDAGGEAIVAAAKYHLDTYPVSLPPIEFARRLAGCACAVGNSSGFIRDSGFYGTPTINVGDRQEGRECGPNVMHVKCERSAIANAIAWQIDHGHYKPSDIYGDGHVSERIVAALANLGRAAA